MSAKWICISRLSQVGSPKNIFMQLKVRVWGLFCKALILLGSIILVNHDFDLYGTLSWPQSVDTQTLVALASQKQRIVCPCRVTCASFFRDGGRHSGLQLHGPGPVEPGFPRLLPVPCKGPHLQSWKGNICLVPGNRISKTRIHQVHL